MPIKAQSADGVEHEFPDGTPGAVVDRAMRDYAMQSSGQGDQWQLGTADTPWTAPKVTGNKTVDTAIEPVTGYWQRQGQAAQSGYDMAAHGLKTLAKGDPTGLIGVAAGGAGYLASPVSAAVEPIARPINEYVSPLLEKTFGTPREISTPILTSLVPGLGVTRVPGMRGAGEVPAARPAEPMRAPAPTKDQIRLAADQAYADSEAAGVVIRPDAINKMAHGLRRELTEFGFHPKLQPGAAIALDEITSTIENGNVTLKGLDLMRQVIKDAAQPGNFKDAKVVGKIVKNIDKMVRNLDENDVVMGNAKEGVGALLKGRENWSKLAKAEIIDSAVDKAVRRAEKNGSGGNLENSLRQEIDAILNKPSKLRGFSGQEVAAMRRVVKGNGNLHEMARIVGKLSPRGNGLMLALFGGGTLATMNPAVLLPAAAGMIAKPVSTALTKGNINRLSEMVRRGPEPKQPPQRPLIPYGR